MTNLLYVTQGLSIIAGLVYLKSSVGKLKNPYTFSHVIQSYKIPILNPIAMPIGIIMGPLEFVLGIALIINFYRVEALYIALILQLIFIVLMLIRFNKVLPFGCGCFGLHGPGKVTSSKIIFNFLYSILLVFILVHYTFFYS
ncbi:MauE/DoxX family redox-associated membrane protein [Bacillus paramycoides]|uniref:Methylamine utilisation protein MauE domain-containing protein n=1 Tax=Bacillus paramycoides TaxID=2026194 RepID=A0A1J9U7M5_9BACI|nr:MauE/DoxX family redox-associated membrane protein [Bacillus paramycoides]OJD73993.1 hypothetical protein BAU28_18450 [Bacillus paramycoides]